MDDPYGSSRGTHNYPSPNAARSYTHPAANPNPPPPSTAMRTTYRPLRPLTPHSPRLPLSPLNQ